MIEKQLPVLGMSCSACAISLNKKINALPGVKEVKVNYASENILLVYDDKKCSLDEIVLSAKKLGYQILAENTSSKVLAEKHSSIQQNLKLKLIVASFLSLPVLLSSMFFKNVLPYQGYIEFLLTLLVMVYSGVHFYKPAFNQFKNKQLGMDALVVISTLAAFLFSTLNLFFPAYLLSKSIEPHLYFESVVMIITFILLGKYIEDLAKYKSSESIRNLMKLRPKKVLIIKNGEEVAVPIEEVNISDIVIIKPGEQIAIDGKVKRGTSYVDESMINGESKPIKKSKGDLVYSGTINSNGVLKVLVQKELKDSFIEQMIAMVQKAQSSKPAVQLKVDKIASIFVPIVIIISFITFISWLFFTNSGFTIAFVSAINVLIIACPCALGLATPTAIVVGIGKAAEENILVKNVQAFQELNESNKLVVDKTGTLTTGNFKVNKVDELVNGALSSYSELIFNMEKNAQHPVAKSILNYLTPFITESKLSLEEKVEMIDGGGLKLIFNDHTYYLGNKSLFNTDEIYRTDEKLEGESIVNQTEIYFGTADKIYLKFYCGDDVKEEASRFITEMNTLNKSIVLLSGDHLNVTKSVANQLNISDFRAACKPLDKLQYISNLQSNHDKVVMIGDGMNDAAAIAKANVGIAMGTGTDIAIESASIVIRNSNLSHIVKAFKISKFTLKTIYQNLFWAFIYNIFAIPIAAGVLYTINGFLLTPMIASIAMAFSSVSVVLNSLRLKYKTR